MSDMNFIKIAAEVVIELDKAGLKVEANEVVETIEKVAAQKSKGKKTKKWIPKDLKEGRFTSYCKSHGFDGPSEACAAKAMESDDESVRGMASFYRNVAKKKKGKE